MAKPARLNRPPAVARRCRDAASSNPPAAWPQWLAHGSLIAVAAAVVQAAYWPSDSTLVQAGGARYLVGLLLLAAMFACWARSGYGGAAMDAPAGCRPRDWLARPDVWAWGIACWMLLSTWANAGEANLRLAVNELWWWVAAAALLTAMRGATAASAAAALLRLLVAISAGVAVYAWHQWWWGIPAMIAQFEADPVALARQAGVDAEPGSAKWISFENRLRDGGPTGPFALANSMAALLVGGTVVTIGMTAWRWRGSPLWQRGASLMVLVVIAAMVLASRSRAAVASLLIVAALLAGWRAWSALRDGAAASGTAGTWRWPCLRRRPWLCGLALTVLSGLAAGLAWRLGRHTEWIGQAPISLAFRLRYTATSLRMLADSPLFGVGPGQFKMRYEAFRPAQAIEQIADPHNWLMQCATTGGIPALLLMLALVTTVVLRLRRSRHAASAPETAAPAAVTARRLGPQPQQIVYLGAVAGLLSIWLVGLVVLQVPSLEEAVPATVIAVVTMMVMHRRRPLSADHAADACDGIGEGREGIAVRHIAAWAALAMAIDLLVAGGLTVPGIAVPLWVLVGIAASGGLARQAMPASSTSGSANDPSQRPIWRHLVVPVGCLALLLAWYRTAVLPVERSALAMGRFEASWGEQRYGPAEAALREARDADPWDPQPASWLTQLYLQMALFEPQRREHWESLWRQSETETLRRAGSDAVMLRSLADGHLWHYQRFGKADSLRAAAELYQRAVELSPSHETYWAQLAEIARELGQPRAPDLAAHAAELSELGGLFERTLPFLRVMPAHMLGDQSPGQPVYRPASEVLAPLLPED